MIRKVLASVLTLSIGFTIGIYATDKASVPDSVLVEAGRLAGYSYYYGCVAHTAKEVQPICLLEAQSLTINLIDLLLLKKR